MKQLANYTVPQLGCPAEPVAHVVLQPASRPAFRHGQPLRQVLDSMGLLCHVGLADSTRSLTIESADRPHMALRSGEAEKGQSDRRILVQYIRADSFAKG